MTQLTGTIDDFGMDTVSLAGCLDERLDAVRAAGFSQVMLHPRDLVDDPRGSAAAFAAVRSSGLRITGLRVARGFDGLAGSAAAYPTDVAKALLELCAKAGADTLVCASAPVVSAAPPDRDALARDLRKLAMLAVPLGVRIACEASGRERGPLGLPLAWELIPAADVPNLGLAVDLLESIDSGVADDDLDLLDPQKIFVVQLADATADGTHRVFPGAGRHRDALAARVRRLDRLGYRGDYSFDVRNDDYRQLPPAVAARHAFGAAQWFGEDVLRRSVPLPGRMRLRRG